MFFDIAKIIVIFCKESDMILCSGRDVCYVYVYMCVCVCVCVCKERRGEKRHKIEKRKEVFKKKMYINMRIFSTKT